MRKLVLVVPLAMLAAGSTACANDATGVKPRLMQKTITTARWMGRSNARMCSIARILLRDVLI